VGICAVKPTNNVTVTPGQQTIAPMLLKKGLTLTGTAVDEEGKPAKVPSFAPGAGRETMQSSMTEATGH
jgi:hypothetical protein